MIQNIPKFIKNETEETKKEVEIKYYDTVLENIETGFVSEYYDTSNLDGGEEEVIEIDNMKVTLTTTQNQVNNTKNNMTSIYLGECEILLRKFYNISDDKLLYMKKIDVTNDGMKIPKVEFDIFCKLTGTSLIKLNKSICESSEYSLSIPVDISDDLDKLNTSGKYYNDRCSKATSNSGTDMSLKDRQKEFVEGNKTVCQDDCNFYDYDKNTQKANCSCKITESASSIADMAINSTKLYENFDDVKTEFSNLGVTSCNVFASKENIESNTGFYLLLIILILFIIIFIIFCTRGYRNLGNKIDEVIYKKFNNKNKSKRKQKDNKIKRTITKENRNISKKSKIRDNKKTNKNINIENTNNTRNLLFKSTKKENNNSKNVSSIFQNKNNNKKNEALRCKPDTDYELNWLTYKDALKFDKRTECEYFCSLIKSKQLLIFTFCSFNDYNSGIIKIFILFLSFALHYTVNALFFDESNMHQIFEDKGKFNFKFQLPFIIYSAIISTFILRLMLQFLVLTDKDILQVKYEETKEKAIQMKKIKLKNIKIKFAIFFILNFILLGLFWYYLTSFNAIYENTQVYLIENTFFSFGISLFYPFIINILPTIIRMSSIHSSNKDQQYLYKVSQVIQIV